MGGDEAAVNNDELTTTVIMTTIISGSYATLSYSNSWCTILSCINKDNS